MVKATLSLSVFVLLCVVCGGSGWMIDCGISDWDVCRSTCPDPSTLACEHGTYEASLACDCCYRCRKGPWEPCGGRMGEDYAGECAEGYQCHYKMTPAEERKWLLFNVRVRPGVCRLIK